MSIKTFQIQVNGRVQGVGFRPFVFNLAKQNQLKGTVSNNENGVIIRITTSREKADEFLKTLLEKPPPVSIVRSYKFEEIAAESFNEFGIIPSENNATINIPLTPDFAICDSCKEEIKDPLNRRYNYPFTTCVNCGPRYAITTKFPFERMHTTLSGFEMCPRCEAEYKDPNNRRFHSQTNSCADCGIQLSLVDADGTDVSSNQESILRRAARFISEGKIIALKNTNGYLLCCDASNIKAIQKLRSRKKRPNKPFAVLYNTIEDVEKDFQISSKEKQTLTSTIAPIVILENSATTGIATGAIAPGLHQTGVMLPSSSLLKLMMDLIKRPIICTSGNIHGSPIIADNTVAQEKLKKVADYFVHHNLQIQFPQDDSVVRLMNERQILLRRSRGYAPNYLTAENKMPSNVLAMGAHLKSTFSLIPNSHIYVSQYFGNLDGYDVLERYKKTLNRQLSVFDNKPQTVLIDPHPNYQSSILGKNIAKANNAKTVKIQHHKAHFGSVLGEHQLFNSEERVLGVVWDGTGYGDDGSIWGGEFFIYENRTIQRANHFEYFDWLANDKMAQEPRLSLLSLLDETQRHHIRHKFSDTEWKVYTKMLENSTLKTSSVGRLFDAVAAALDIKDFNTFEAEAAMLLENCATIYSKSYYIDFLYNVDYENVPSKRILGTILNTYKEGFCKERLAYSFIYTLAKTIIRFAKKHHINTVACSGGVFQNRLLIQILSRLCRSHKIMLKLNRILSANDENISFGQLMCFHHIKK